ncbi:MAG TPA: CHAP domain-containing protein, partial [Candidatus Dormibacteraeota bacterium]|nr:CHAP domain-containing protein [Candidatus Dormibacteraeota bacterium]
AWAWYGNAQAKGFATGHSPRPGAIMVTWESGYGHVAFVESVSVDGSWIVSEMNYVAFNTVDRRLIRPGGVPLIGFIY